MLIIFMSEYCINIIIIYKDHHKKNKNNKLITNTKLINKIKFFLDI